MSSPLRFLAAAVLLWVGVRAAGDTLLPEPLAAIPLPPPQTPLLDTQLAYAQPAPQYPPAAPAAAGYPMPAYSGQMPVMRPQPYPVPIYYPVPQPHPGFAPAAAPMSTAPLLDYPLEEPELALLDGWPDRGGGTSGAAWPHREPRPSLRLRSRRSSTGCR